MCKCVVQLLSHVYGPPISALGLRLLPNYHSQNPQIQANISFIWEGHFYRTHNHSQQCQPLGGVSGVIV